MKGYLLAHRTIERDVYPVDMRHFADHRIKVIMRWNWGYAGTGTVPPMQHEQAWIEAMVATVKASQGVWVHSFFNEYNNPTEWTGGYPNVKEILTPWRVLDLYERVIARLPDVLVAPGAVDPFNVVAQEFGQPGDPKVWFDTVINGATRVDAILLHAKTQTNDPAECASDEEFSHPPLIGRHLHLKTFEDQLGWVRPGLRDKPVIITELNPQRIDKDTLGWKADNREWIRAAVAELDKWNAGDGQLVSGVCFYRYDTADPWGLRDKPELLDEIKRQANRA